MALQTIPAKHILSGPPVRGAVLLFFGDVGRGKNETGREGNVKDY